MKLTDLAGWREAVELAVLVYAESNGFPKSEMYGLSLQMRKAAVSIPSNIAEGEGRSSPKETYHFQCTARGSLLELETQVIISARLGYLTADAAERLQSQVSKVASKLTGMINHSKSKFPKTKQEITE